MATSTEQSAPVYSVCDLSYEQRVYILCRDVPLPRDEQVGPKLTALRTHYWTHTGRELPVWDAIRILDRIHAERYDVPFPAAYSRIADLLLREDYSVGAIHAVVAHLRRGGTVATCPHLESAERATAEGLLPRDAAPCRCREGA